MNERLTDIKERYEPIENYGVIGNLHTVVLISKKGSIDFMSYTRFDSPTVFAALLDANKGGHFSIDPTMDNIVYKQLYLPDTAILITRFLSDQGIAEIMDFMPIYEDEANCAIVRKVTTIRGEIDYKMHCCPRFDYARATHTTIKETGSVTFKGNDELSSTLHILSDAELAINNGDVSASFTLKERESVYFILESTEHKQQRTASLTDYIENCYRNTISFWQGWIEKSNYRGRWMEMVNRSTITLKLLTSYRFGSVVAAATFGLPESIGGKRNWDYRYTWIRDASFTMYVFLKLGFMDEAAAFLKWIQRQCVKGRLQLMYAVDGRTDLQEYCLEHWEGYKGSKPVRIGNQAHIQFQLDVYGELLDTIYLFNAYGGEITYGFWQEIAQQVEIVTEKWKEPDHGIWEIRNDKKEFLYSRLMCWVAMDRAIKIAENRSFPYDREKWEAVRNEIFHSIYDEFWNEEVQSFVQYKGTTAIDASALMMPLRNFISPVESKWVKTMHAIANELRVDVLIYRYNNMLTHVDGLTDAEGTFSMCSFWFVECLAKSGHVEKARELFEKMLSYTNHLGLFSEEIGAKGEQLGNYPQAFTHLGLISAALTLNELLGKEEKDKYK
ncbi:MAG: glycoside hydrolase family 15 protein [Flavipsychrobacter sp.]